MLKLGSIKQQIHTFAYLKWLSVEAALQKPWKHDHFVRCCCADVVVVVVDQLFCCEWKAGRPRNPYTFCTRPTRSVLQGRKSRNNKSTRRRRRRCGWWCSRFIEFACQLPVGRRLLLLWLLCSIEVISSTNETSSDAIPIHPSGYSESQVVLGAFFAQLSKRSFLQAEASTI